MDYKGKTIFHLPGIFEFPRLYQYLLNIITERPELLRRNVKIGSVYGSPGAAIWNGGRFVDGMMTKQELTEIKLFMEEKQIPVRFTFTNCLIEEEHLNDTYCHNILTIFVNGNNEIICNSPLLEEALRKRYMNFYKFISSTTKRLQDKQEQLDEIEKDYYLVVLDYDHNYDDIFLKQIKNKDKCEILCNPVCRPNCPNRARHYENISYCQLNNAPDELMKCDDSCKTFAQARKNENFISIERINELLELGFSNFKLEGRTAHPLDLIEILLYYLIKEEYQPELRIELQKVVW